MRTFTNSKTKHIGIYNSIWINKFSNMFIKRGKKKKIIKHVNMCLTQIKIANNISPIIYLFEIIDNIKPTFKLENIFPNRRTAIIYPKAVNRYKRYVIAIKWIKLYILETRYNLGRGTIIKFWHHLYSNITQLSEHKSNLLIKKRDEYHQRAINLQDNIRYTWVK